MVRKTYWLLPVFLLSSLILRAQPGPITVPAQLTFCGLELTLTPAAQAEIQRDIQDFGPHTAHFRELVKRMSLYLPFIEEALDDQQVPRDLVYLAIQESGLQALAESPSQAVGFWQFKAETGRDHGLQIDDRVDERAHIRRSTLAAADYLRVANEQFDNWFYSILSFHDGRTGVLKHLDSDNYGARSMVIDKHFHWYGLKTLAYKIACEAMLSEVPEPGITLLPYATMGEQSLKVLAEAHRVSLAHILDHNPWILSRRNLPPHQSYTYYLALPKESYVTHSPDPHKLMDQAVSVSGTPPSVNPSRPEAGSPLPPPSPVAQPPQELPAETTTPRPAVVITPLPPKEAATPPDNPATADQEPLPAADPSRPRRPQGSRPAPSGKQPSKQFVPPSRPATNPAPPSQPAPDPQPAAASPFSTVSDAEADAAHLLPAQPASELHPTARATFALRDDLHHGQAFLWYDGRYLLHEVALRYQLPYRKLVEWNGLKPGNEPPANSLIRLVKPRKAEVHVVQEGETLVGIAAHYQVSPRRLQRKNRMHKEDFHLYIGQKLYLRKKKPKGEKIIILEMPQPTPGAVASSPRPQPKPQPQSQPAPQSLPSRPASPPVKIQPLPAPEPTPDSQAAGQALTHRVAQGETLWGISVQYATTVETLKQLNRLSSNNIQPGQVLLIQPAGSPAGGGSSRSRP